MNNPENAASQKAKLKRFYKEVAVASAEDGWHVLLDGRAMRTPAKASLKLPTQKLAQAVADEWQRQGDFVELDGMLQMQFACSAIDYTQHYRADVEEETLAYITTDLLCYRVQEPAELVQLQKASWNPWLDWAERRFHIRMPVVLGILPVQLPSEVTGAMEAQITALDDFKLTALWLAAKHTGSLLLALAVLEKAITATEAFGISRLEEDFQNQRWGVDEEARRRRDSGAAEMAGLGEFISLIQ